jgi:hypothetical protein
VKILLSALALGEPEDYRRIFLDGGQSLASILRRCQTFQQDSIGVLPSSGYIESLLDALQPDEEADRIYPRIASQPVKSATVQTDSGFPINLSPRELEVLSLIAEANPTRKSQLNYIWP